MFRSALTLLVLTAAVGGLATAVTADEDDGFVRKAYDVSALTRTEWHQHGPLLGALVGQDGWSEHEHWEERAEAEPYLGGEQLVDLIRTSIRPADWEVDGTWLEFRDQRLVVRQRAEIVREVETLLLQLAAGAAQRVLLQVEMLEQDGGTGGCRISGSIELPCGVLKSLAVTNRVDYVGEYEVEIAQASNISNPVPLTLEEGLAVEAIAHPLLDGKRVALELLLQSCCLDGMRSVELGVDEESFGKPYRSPGRFASGTVQLPACSHADVHVTVIVPTGEDVLIPVIHGGRSADLRLHVELLGASAESARLGLGALTTPPMVIRAGGDRSRDKGSTGALVAQRLRVHEGEPSAPLGEIDEVIELLHTGVAPSRWEEGDERLEGTSNDQGLLIVARPDLRARVRHFLEAREAASLRPVVVDVAVLSVRDAVRPGPGRDLDPELSSLVTSGRLHTVSGRWASMRLGTTRNYLADYDVEVAQEARIPDPITGQSFGGLVANVRPYLPLGGRNVRVDLDLLYSMDELVEEAFDTGTQYLGPVEQVRSRRTRIDTSIGVPLGGRTLIDAGPDPQNPGARLVVAISVKTP